MRGRWWPWLLLVLGLVPALLIHGARRPMGGATPTENVTIAIFGNPATLDPALASTPTEWEVDSNVFQPLFIQKVGGGIGKNLVQTYTISGRTLTLTLKPLTLTNNHPLTAAIVAGALARPLWPQVHSTLASTLLQAVAGSHSVYRGKARYLSGVADVNRTTVTIRLTHAVTPGFLKSLANPALSIVPTADLTRGGPDWQVLNLYGTGGFRLTNWTPGGSLSFARVRGRGPSVLQLQIYNTLRPALLAFKNGVLSAVPINPEKLSLVPSDLVKDIRPLTVPGDLYLVYRRGAIRVSAYPRLNINRWVKDSFRGRITALPGAWPTTMRNGRPMTIYVNQAMPEAVQLAQTLARLEKGRVTVAQVSATQLHTMAKHNQINAYIGQANLFKSGTTIPLAPQRSLWLLTANFSRPSVFANGVLNWHSLTARK